MSPEEAGFRKRFFNSLTLSELEPGDPRYVSLYDEVAELRNSDPVALLRSTIELTPAPTVQLLSGFRGTGKSTELRRLRKALQDAGHIVLLIDVEDYLNLSQPIDAADFIFAFAGAFGDAADETGRLWGHPTHEGVWTRLINFFTRTEVSLPELNATAKASGDVAAGLKLALKDNPSFRERVRKHGNEHLGGLVAEVREFVTEVSAKLREGLTEDAQVVVLVDSIEHIRGTSQDAERVQSSVERLFTAHTDLLHLPAVHVVYTIHPYLKIRYANLGDLYDPGGVQLVPTLKVRERPSANTPDVLGKRHQSAIEAMESVVEARGEWWRLLGSGDEGKGRLEELILASGGHLRDLIRLLLEVTRRARSLPVSRDVVDAAIEHVRNEALPIADDDALWLADIARSREPCLPSQDKLPALARFLDTHQVLCYRNGNEWFDVHPLIRETVLKQADAVRARRASKSGK